MIFADSVLGIKCAAFDSGGFSIRDLSLSFSSGLSLLIGPSKAGKTAIFRLLNGSIPVAGCEIALMGMDFASGNIGLKMKTGFVQADSPFPGEFTLKKAASFYSGFYNDWDSSIFAAKLREYGLIDSLYFKDLSKTENILFMMAASMCRSVQYIFIDDCHSAHSLEDQQRLKDAIGQVLADGISVLFMSRNAGYLAGLAGSVAVIRSGKVLFNGPIDDIDCFNVVSGDTSLIDRNMRNSLFGFSSKADGFTALADMRNLAALPSEIVSRPANLDEITSFMEVVR